MSPGDTVALPKAIGASMMPPCPLCGPRNGAGAVDRKAEGADFLDVPDSAVRHEAAGAAPHRGARRDVAPAGAVDMSADVHDEDVPRLEEGAGDVDLAEVGHHGEDGAGLCHAARARQDGRDPGRRRPETGPSRR